MKPWNVVLLGALLGVALVGEGCAGPATQEGDAEQALLEADRAFARDTAERGLEGWVAAFAPDAVRVELEGGVVRGRSAIREQDAGMFEDPSLRLEWAPTVAGVFESGDHGFTRGRYELVRNADGPGREVVSSGTYLTVWRKDAGRWQVILDTGVPDME